MNAVNELDSLQEGDANIDGFALTNGVVLDTVNLHYRTLGTRKFDEQGDTTNAVLLLHGTTGSSSQFLRPSFANAMFGPGQPLDAQEWFVIMPDAIGHGDSTKPSDGLNEAFPRYGYRDVVAGQRVLVERLGVAHLRLVVGTSMGGMNTWMWGELFPDRVDALIPIACAPRPITGANLLWREMITRAIRADIQEGSGSPIYAWRRYTAMWPLFAFVTNSPVALAAISGVEDAADYLIQQEQAAPNAFDLLFAIEASSDYDPEPLLTQIRAPLLAINFADDAVNPSELDPLGPALRRVPSASLVMCPATQRTDGHETLNQADVYAEHVSNFLAKVRRQDSATAKHDDAPREVHP